MAQESPLPPSIEAAATTDRTIGTDPVLLRLHAALKGLDDAICETRRALDVALGRSAVLLRAHRRKVYGIASSVDSRTTSRW
jgi:hypothetical protein